MSPYFLLLAEMSASFTFSLKDKMKIYGKHAVMREKKQKIEEPKIL